MKQSAFHEDFGREEAVEGSTDRGFGLVIGTACLLVGGASLWFGSNNGLWWCAAGAAFLVTALVRPALLRRLNRLWLKLALVLFAVVNPVVMAIMYYLCIVPIGLLMRAMGKDLLGLKRDPSATTYWKPRVAAASGSMRNQY